MMKNKKRSILALTAASAVLLAGCGNGGTKKDNADSQVTLKWILGSPGVQKDSDEVWKLYNEKLSEQLPNTNVEFECITTTDYAEKWKLISASQENVDIVWHGWMLPYVTEVKKGSYMELDDLIKENAPDLLEVIPENILAKQRVDGKLYSIPNMQQMVSYISAVDISYDNYEKLKDKINIDELVEFFASHKTMDKECWDKIEELIKLIKAEGDFKQGAYSFANFVEKGYEWISNPYKIKVGDDTAPAVNLYRTPEYETFVEVISDWYNKGYIRKDVLTADNLSDGSYCVKEGASYLVGQGYLPTQTEIDKAAASGKSAFVHIPTENSHYIPYAASATNTAISINSKNPERAIKLIDLMNTDKGKDLYNLLVFGIEGKHYTKVNDKEIEPIGYTTQANSDSPYGQYKWAVGNTFNAYEMYMKDKNVIYTNDFIKKINEEAKASDLKGFTLDTDPIKTELAQVTAVMGEYTKTLNSGAAPDAKKLYEDFVEKLKVAGDDKVTEEITRQINEFRKNK